MKDQMLVNMVGEVWEVEFKESTRLTHIDGFLMMYDGLGRITISTAISSEFKEQVRLHFLEILSNLPVNKVGVRLLAVNGCYAN